MWRPDPKELDFRGHLLPRLERYGRWAPVINTALFATYHLFSPWAISRDLPRVPAHYVDGLAEAQRRRVHRCAHDNQYRHVLLLAGLSAGD